MFNNYFITFIHKKFFMQDQSQPIAIAKDVSENFRVKYPLAQHRKGRKL